jgi:hypothetical protein
MTTIIGAAPIRSNTGSSTSLIGGLHPLAVGGGRHHQLGRIAVRVQQVRGRIPPLRFVVTWGHVDEEIPFRRIAQQVPSETIALDPRMDDHSELLFAELATDPTRRQRAMPDLAPFINVAQRPLAWHQSVIRPR